MTVDIQHNNIRPEDGWSVYQDGKLKAIYFSEEEAETAKIILEKGFDLSKTRICKR